MTVGELRARLAEFPDDYEVILRDTGCEVCMGPDYSAGSVRVTPNTVDGHGLAVEVGW